jgi:hypothetical protein
VPTDPPTRSRKLVNGGQTGFAPLEHLDDTLALTASESLAQPRGTGSY